MDTLIQDIRYAIRALGRTPMFTAIAVTTLAIGISATTSIFSIVDAVLLRPLPFPEASRVVVPQSRNQSTGDVWNVTYADFKDWRDQKVFDKVALFQPANMDLAGGADPLRVSVGVVTSQFFSVLGARAVHGRLFIDSDFPVSAPRAMVITSELWQRQFGGDTAVVGRMVDLNGIRRPIVGVLPAGFNLPAGADLYVPLRIASETDPDVRRRDNFVYAGIARLKPGASTGQTNLVMEQMAARIRKEEPVIRKDVTTFAMPVLDWMVGPSTPKALWILLGSVGFVLLIGCVNIANLQLARGSSRHRELAVRTALGANRGRLMRQMLTEGALISLAGAALGVLFSIWAVGALVAAAPPEVPRLEAASVNPMVLAFAAAVAVAATFLFGLAPALQASRSDPAHAMNEGSLRATASGATARLRHFLVVAELALSLVLLVGAGLSIRSILKLQRVDPGFDTAHVITASISLPGAKYDSSYKVRRFWVDLRRQLGAVPGVTDVGVASASPLGAGGFYLGRMMLAEGRPAPPAGTEVSISWNVATPGYFKALGVPLLQGRDFSAADDSGTTPVIIVNRQFAKEMFPNESPIGKRVKSSRDENLLREIIGVVGDVKYNGAADATRSLVWVPYTQNSWGIGIVTVRTSVEPTSVVSAIRQQLKSLDASVALANVTSMDKALSSSMAGTRLVAVLLGAFAGIALLLAAIGVYGVLSYTVEQRTHEMGVRLALGARPTDVVRLVVRQVAGLALIGIAVGLGTAAALSRFTSSLLFDTSPWDPATFLSVPIVLSAVTLLAAFIPARRASHVDPVVALRNE